MPLFLALAFGAGWLFPPTWALLYTAMAVAAWMAWKQRDTYVALWRTNG